MGIRGKYTMVQSGLSSSLSGHFPGCSTDNRGAYTLLYYFQPSLSPSLGGEGKRRGTPPDPRQEGPCISIQHPCFTQDWDKGELGDSPRPPVLPKKDPSVLPYVIPLAHMVLGTVRHGRMPLRDQRLYSQNNGEIASSFQRRTRNDIKKEGRVSNPPLKISQNTLCCSGKDAGANQFGKLGIAHLQYLFADVLCMLAEGGEGSLRL